VTGPLTAIEIEPEIGLVPDKIGDHKVSPAQETKYTLAIQKSNGEVIQKSVTLKVK
jgi:hypothetical protein